MKKERCEVEKCRKYAQHVLGYVYRWGERGDMQKGLVPMYRRRMTFRCDTHKDEWGDIVEGDRLGVMPISKYYELTGSA